VEEYGWALAVSAIVIMIGVAIFARGLYLGGHGHLALGFVVFVLGFALGGGVTGNYCDTRNNMPGSFCAAPDHAPAPTSTSTPQRQ
jgi:hypothetical protein